jgi:hypothetical protein
MSPWKNSPSSRVSPILLKFGLKFKSYSKTDDESILLAIADGKFLQNKIAGKHAKIITVGARFDFIF